MTQPLWSHFRRNLKFNYSISKWTFINSHAVGVRYCLGWRNGKLNNYELCLFFKLNRNSFNKDSLNRKLFKLHLWKFQNFRINYCNLLFHENRPSKMNLFWSQRNILQICLFQKSVLKMNLMIISGKYVTHSEIGFSTKSIFKPFRLMFNPTPLK